MVRQLQNRLNLDFFDRTQVVFIKTDGQKSATGFQEVKQAIEKGELTEDSKVFNNAVQTEADFEAKWLQNAKDSWLKRFFKKQTRRIATTGSIRSWGVTG